MNPRTKATFFLNTGRCGSQFFASTLKKYYADLARVEHEPFAEYYRPPHFFSSLSQCEAIDLSDELNEHFDSIKKTLETRHYVETGWPAYGVIPYLIEEFKDRIRIVHLFRHPAKTAASLTTHNVYSRGEWTETMSITPSHFGITQVHLSGDKWVKLDDFSKCLFWWTEINSFALRFHTKRPDIPWFSLKFEEVFSRNSQKVLRDLVEFLDFPIRAEFLGSSTEKIDRYSGKTSQNLDIGRINEFCEAVELMNKLGYQLDDNLENEINRRYQKSDLVRFIEEFKRLLRFGS